MIIKHPSLYLYFNIIGNVNTFLVSFYKTIFTIEKYTLRKIERTHINIIIII